MLWEWLGKRELTGSHQLPHRQSLVWRGGGRGGGGCLEKESTSETFSKSHPLKGSSQPVTHSLRNASCHGNLFFRVSDCREGTPGNTLRTSGSLGLSLAEPQPQIQGLQQTLGPAPLIPLAPQRSGRLQEGSWAGWVKPWVLVLP